MDDEIRNSQELSAVELTTLHFVMLCAPQVAHGALLTKASTLQPCLQQC
jgi:hypothetical protein